MCSCFSQVQRFVVGKSATQDIALTLYVLGWAQDFLVVDHRVFIPQVLLNRYSNIHISLN